MLRTATFGGNRFTLQGRHIKRLTVTTVLILSAMVALQFYWLLSSYRQQQEQLHNDIDNALATTNARLLTQKIMAKQPPAIREMFDFEESATGPKRSSKPGSMGKSGKKIHLINSVVKLDDTSARASMLAFLDSLNAHTQKGTGIVQVELNFSDTDLVHYKKIYARELKARQIKIPFDLALVDTSDRIYNASCDTGLFRKYAYRSSFNEIQGTERAFGLVAGFQNPNYFVLRNMIWILIITLTLIILGCASLSYLLVTFFRQGKITEIRNDFMNNMTHELKTPISSISLAFEMVLDDQYGLSQEKKTSYLVSAQKETSRLKLIVENVLKILSLEKAGLDIIKSEIAVQPWLEAIIERITPLLENRNVVLQVTITPESLNIYADEVHISNVIYNILENAVKYNDKPDPLIRIVIEKQQDTVQFCIQDNGQGIPEKYLDKIFDKFFRVPKDYQHDEKGYGLGLSYVKQVVAMHDGSITVQSTAGKETNFIMHLPINK